MKKIITGMLCVYMSASMFSCTYNNEEELYPPVVCDTTHVSYLETIEPIIIHNCYECHSGTEPISGFSLEGHANLKAKVDDGRLIGAIRHMVGFSPMPKDRPSLPDCDILKIEKWVSDGAPNN